MTPKPSEAVIRDVLDVARHVARNMDVTVPTPWDLEHRLRCILFEEQNLLGCLDAGIVTSEEVRNRVLAEIESSLRGVSDLAWGEGGNWLTEAIQQRTDAALFDTRE